mmetsp:Transcript_24854/g.76742  ORF Transcript_24854/g.76742 Transcript_24854/m.76742 type:complete len:244 (-) Transcript_24854:591-1322(-)
MRTELELARCEPEEQRYKLYAYFAFLLDVTKPGGTVTKEDLLAQPELGGILTPHELTLLRDGGTHSTAQKRKRRDIALIANLVAVAYEIFIVWASEQQGLKITECQVWGTCIENGEKKRVKHVGFRGMQLRRSGDPSPWRGINIPTSVQVQLDFHDDAKKGIYEKAKPTPKALETRKTRAGKKERKRPRRAAQEKERKRPRRAAQAAVIDGTDGASGDENCNFFAEADLEAFLNGALDKELGL